MKLVEQLETRAMRFGTMSGANVFTPDLVAAVRDRYSFWEAPTKIAECDLDAGGANFTTGRFKDHNVDALRILRTGILAQGILSTETLDAFLDDLIQFASDRFGLTHTETEPVGRAYLNAVSVEMTNGFEARFDSLKEAQNTLERGLRALGFSTGGYQFHGLTLQTDPQQTSPIQPSKFLIERRANTPYSSHTFYSEAPLATADHIRLLEQLDLFF